MNEKISLQVLPDGSIRMPYDDGIQEFAHSIGAEIETVRRASNVEWEEFHSVSGWTVRAAHNPSLAIRLHPKEGHIVSDYDKLLVAVFQSRDTALKWERELLWNLLPKP